MILEIIFGLLLFTILSLFFITSNNKDFLKYISVVSSSFILILSCYLFVSFFFDNKSIQFYFILSFLKGITNLNINFSFGLDGLSILFFLLSSFLIFLCVLFIQKEKFLKEYLILMFILLLMLLIIFSTLDLFIFYVFFEALLIPMFLIIGLWGSRERKIRAAYLLFFYTVCGSLLFLISLLYIYFVTGTFDYESISSCIFKNEKYLWFGFFISFASKIPMFPFHIWLPEAHVEAPTVGSVLLAGILLKLGIYGFLRYSFTLFSSASLYFGPFVYLLSLIGIIYSSLNAIRQTDIKRIVAYSSIAHMNLIMLGLYSYNEIGFEGAIIQSISHGFVSGALFFLIGILYNRYHTRLLFYFSGLVHTMPIYSSLLLFFTMANIALPGTSSFIGEFTILIGLFKTSPLSAVIGTTSVILSGAYSLWMYNRIVFGNLKTNYTLDYKDINRIEILVLIPLVFLVLLMGVCPQIFFSTISFNSIITLHYYSDFFLLCI